jgi:hypothetical protein
MPAKSFETTIPFVKIAGNGWEPVILVTFLRPRAPNLELALLFDTGADRIVLQPSWEDCFENLEDTTFGGLGGIDQPGKHTAGRIQLLGQIVDCDIGFTKMTERTWMQGVFGRECFKAFGFGFWEKSHELYVTVKP